MAAPGTCHPCLCADCWGIGDNPMAARPLFSKRMAIIDALLLDQSNGNDHRTATEFHKRLFALGYEVVKRHHKEHAP